MKPLCIQINWQREFGGGEIYTRFLTLALQSLGWDVELIVERKAVFWSDLGLDGVRFVPIDHERDVPAALPHQPVLVISHNVLGADVARAVAARHRLSGIIHMPLTGRNPRGLVHYRRIFPVSAYVRDTALACGLDNVYHEPLLGVADLAPRAAASDAIMRRSEYAWDRRKFRDRLFSWIDPLAALRPTAAFTRRPGLTLGLVSRLTPIKQFPQLFAHLAPILAAAPGVNLEVFGSGGYASVRDLRAALRPLGPRARFWGMQSDPAAVYRQLDYVLSGLPEREALGLNLIEAQAVGTPVLAVDAPPFTETVIDGASGYLYADPRRDGGTAFRELLGGLVAGGPRPDPRLAKQHLERFSPTSFRARVGAALAEIVP